MSLSTEETDETAATRKSRHRVTRHLRSPFPYTRRTRSSSRSASAATGTRRSSEVGQRAGIFKKHGLVLEILYTQGGGETQQAVISGSVDIGVAAGIMGVAVRVLEGRAGAHHRRARPPARGDLFWYVPADSPIKSLKDTDGKTHRLLDQRLVDPRHRHGVHRSSTTSRRSRPRPAARRRR